MPPARQQQRNLDDYITVAERIEKFYGKFGDGSLQTVIVFDDGQRIVMQAYAYRTPGDERPGIGTAEEIRGKGPVNQSSAVENCETSAWGRAIAALGFEVKKGVASREEMEQAEAERDRQRDLPAVETISAEDALAIKDLFDRVIETTVEDSAERAEFKREFAKKRGELGIAGGKWHTLTPAQAAALSAWLAEQEES